MGEEQDYRIAALKAAGYEDAARLLEALPGAAGPVAPTEQSQAAEQQQPAEQQPMSPEQAQGQALLDEMKRQIGDRWTSIPIMSEREGVNDGR